MQFQMEIKEEPLICLLQPLGIPVLNLAWINSCYDIPSTYLWGTGVKLISMSSVLSQQVLNSLLSPSKSQINSCQGRSQAVLLPT